MGSLFSSEEPTTIGWRPSKEEPFCPPEDWPYVWAIRDCEMLDWKLPLTPGGPPLSKDETLALADAQAQLPVEIMPHLFLSDARRAHDVELLGRLGITHVFNVAGAPAAGPSHAYAAAGITACNVNADDEEGYRMLAQHLAEAQAFVEAARGSGGKCVVHCVAGINRSGVLAAACLMLHHRIPVLDAVAQCRRARGNCFLWNNTFQEELVALARVESLLGPAPGAAGCRVTAVAPPQEALMADSKVPFNPGKIKALF